MNFNEIANGSVIMLSGDSVTDAGRAYPTGTYRTGLGGGYVNRMHEIITAAYPEKKIKIVNKGISGETSRQVAARWLADLEEVKPDYATLMIGVNDVWRSYDAYLEPGIAVSADEYEKNLRFILENTKTLKGFMLISPIFFELNREDTFMKRIIEYSGICKRLADEYGVAYCDLHGFHIMRIEELVFLCAVAVLHKLSCIAERVGNLVRDGQLVAHQLFADGKNCGLILCLTLNCTVV